jgi:hypothetical protein
MAMTATKPGKWYFFVVCHTYHKEMLIGEAPSPEYAVA